MLVISAGRYSQGMTVGKGFLGLATLVVGNWRPMGVAIGASIFGFFDGVTQRLSPEDLVLALLLAAALLLFAGTIYAFVTKGVTALRFVAAGVAAFGVFVVLRAFFYELGGNVAIFLLWLVVGLAITTAGVVGAVRYAGLSAAIMAMAAVAALFVYLRLDAIPDEFVPMLPYVVTLVVVSSRGQALRPPAAAGEPWFKGQQQLERLGGRADRDAAAWALGERDGDRRGLGGVEDLAGDLGGQRLGEHRAVAESPQIELEALALDAPLARHVDDLHRRDVGLAGDRTHRRQLLGRESDLRDVGWGGEHLDVVDCVPHRGSEHGQFAAFHGRTLLTASTLNLVPSRVIRCERPSASEGAASNGLRGRGTQ